MMPDGVALWKWKVKSVVWGMGALSTKAAYGMESKEIWGPALYFI